ncbi:MAG: hypothetical protein MUP98_16325 [Candidatus Aminicenantes bacterium]|nr:hypothetical protein [Candidatus Aminicenantes bacterium]
MNSEAGRILKLEVVFEIKDEPGEFFFAWPRSFCLDSQKNLFILDEDQLLKFSPDGKLIGNFYKKGQGPGEISTRYQMVSYVIHKDELYVYDGVAKILHMDNDGKVISEIKQTAGRFFQLVGIAGNRFYMRYQTSARGETEGFLEIENQIHLLSPDGSSAEKIIGFFSKIYSGPSFGMDWDKYAQLFNQNDASLYVTHSCEYKIVRSDLNEGKIILSYNREYPRIKFVLPENSQSFYEKYNPPKKKFENDVLKMYLNNDKLWIKTSTVKKDKGKLFDVFDSKGHYTDSFYLNISGGLELVDGEYLYITERDEEENISVKKLKILN